MLRKAKRDFTFSDGTFIPKGTMVVSTVLGIQNDPAHFEDPHIFNPWRFYDTRERAEMGSSKNDFTSPSPEIHAFGYGRHAW